MRGEVNRSRSTRGLRRAPGTLACAGILAGAALPAAAQTILLDAQHTATSWQAMPSEGTQMRLSRDHGALRIDFDFKGHGGYAVAHRALALDLPANYEIVFRIRAQAPVENLELKLIDTTGANVWWDNRRDFHFPAQWTTVRTKKRQISFAWGPAGGGGGLRRLGAVELAVTAGSGGRGVVWIDSLRLRTLPPSGPYTLTPVVSASSSAPGAAPEGVLDTTGAGGWRSAGGGEQWLALDFQQERELGGVRLDWGPSAASAYDVQLSEDGRSWETAYRATDGNGGRDYIPLPETDTRWLRLLLHNGPGAGYELKELLVEPLSFSATPDSMYEVIARESPLGRYPRAYRGEQTYWTIVGVPGSGREALLDMDGRLEPARGGPSIEPFLYAGGRLLAWSDGRAAVALARGDLPVPTVTRSAAGLKLSVTAFAAPDPGGGSSVWARYLVRNVAAARRRATLYLALRPFQVNPPWQFLATQGGVSPIATIRLEPGRTVLAGADTLVVFGSPVADAAGAAPYDAGDVTEYLGEGRVPGRLLARAAHARASGALAYRIDLPPGGAREVCLRIPLGGGPALAGPPGPGDCARRQGEVEARWAALLDRVVLRLGGASGAALARAVRTNLAYILLNRDGPALRPGSRSYARSWIRDGALMAEALLRLGHDSEVRDYIRWYAPYQFPSGKVPCCVDARGADPVPENDSNGELLFLVAEYFRFTADTALVREQWPRLAAAAAYIDTLRHRSMTPEYAAGPKRLFYGLLPESISHEGYSAKPMHSYWDDMWAVRGLEDASFLARVLGRDSAAATLADDAVQLRGDVVASLGASMAQHSIDYLPGAAELGDFDATSTAIALSPLDEGDWLPQNAARQTFEEYWRDFVARRDSTRAWENYTPYEWRVVGALARLGWRERADSAVAFFMGDRRPPAWNEWAEVVWKDARAPRFIGDMPHTWVSAEFVRSVLDLLVYQRGDTLVVGAGVPDAWLGGAGVVVRGLRTRFGALDLSMRRAGDVTRVRLAGDLRLPDGGIVLALPTAGKRVTVNGRELAATAGTRVVRTLPADIEIRSER